MIDDGTALVIERDQGAGTADKACKDAKNPTPDCFATPAVFKRIYKIAFDDSNVGKAVRKIGYIDLMNIKDPDNKKRQGGGEGFYDMPFNTIENVDLIDDHPHHRRPTTTTCPSRPAVRSTRPTTTSSSCWRSRTSSQRSKAYSHIFPDAGFPASGSPFGLVLPRLPSLRHRSGTKPALAG